MFFTFRCTVMLGVAMLSAAAVFAAEKEESHEPAGAQAADQGPAATDDSAHKAHAPHIGAEGVNTDAAEFKSDLAIYTFIVFLLLLAILWKFAWGPIARGLEQREARIHQDIADAEAARVKAEQMLARHAEKLDTVQDEVREILAEARRDAEHTKQEIVSTAQQEAEGTKQRAVGEIERARDHALQELFDAMATRVADATEHVLGRSLDESDRDRFIEEALSQFSERSS